MKYIELHQNRFYSVARCNGFGVNEGFKTYKRLKVSFIWVCLQSMFTVCLWHSQ